LLHSTGDSAKNIIATVPINFYLSSKEYFLRAENTLGGATYVLLKIVFLSGHPNRFW